METDYGGSPCRWDYYNRVMPLWMLSEGNGVECLRGFREFGTKIGIPQGNDRSLQRVPIRADNRDCGAERLSDNLETAIAQHY